MPTLSVIIVSFQHSDILKNCLLSIEKYNDIGKELEVIVSDNSIDNELYDRLIRDFPTVKAIKNDNVGFGKGNNIGFRHSSGKYLMFLNPDTILVEPIFRFIISTFETKEDLALFGIKLLTKEMTKNHSFFMMDNYRVIATILSKILFKFDLYIDGLNYIAGADLIVRRDSFVEAGMFDENMFMYYEEPDLIKRIKKANKCNKTAYYKDKKLIHLEGATESKDISSYISKVKRSLATYEYYCDKWSLDFCKNVIHMRNYQYFKKTLKYLCGKKNSTEQEVRLIQLYEEQIRTHRKNRKRSLL